MMALVLGADLEAALRPAGLELVTRAEWGARPREYLNEIQTPTAYFFVHHAAVESSDDAREVRQHQDFHMDTRGWSDIAYSLLVPDPNPNLIVFEGRGIGVQGGHTQNYNRRSHAVCVLGNFQADRPSASAQDSVARLARRGRDLRWWVPTLHGHRDVASTSCPGDHLYNQLPTIRALVASGEVDDMTPEDHKQIAANMRNEMKRLAQYLALGQGNQAFPSTETVWFGPDAVTLPELQAKHTWAFKVSDFATATGSAADLLRKSAAGGVDIDEAALAASLAPALLQALNPQQVADIISDVLGPNIGQQVVEALAAKLATN